MKTKKKTHAFYLQEAYLEKITEWSTIQNMFFLSYGLILADFSKMVNTLRHAYF